MIPMISLIVLQLQQMHIRCVMKERLEESILQTITLDEIDVHWASSEKEIRIGNELFDVKYYTIENGKIHFTGLYDQEETSIEEQLSHANTQESENRSLVLTQLLNLLDCLYFSQVSNVLKETKPGIIYTVLPQSILPYAFRTILTPPPQQ
jgi:hypothetical protein